MTTFNPCGAVPRLSNVIRLSDAQFSLRICPGSRAGVVEDQLESRRRGP